MIDMKEYGYELGQVNSNEDIVGRVIAVYRDLFIVICKYGEVKAVLKKSIYFNKKLEAYPTVGDYVILDYNKSGNSIIVKTLERKSFFSRKNPDSGKNEQMIAANFDYVFILTSINKDLNTKRLERYLSIAWDSGAEPIILLTKSDLVEDYSLQKLKVEEIAIGVPVYAISSVTRQGFEDIEKYLTKGKTTVFLGSSGVGKSSLVNALCNREVMKVSAIREEDSRGRHTTTHRQMIKMDNGALIIDTPGMRLLGMWDVDEGIDRTFRDIEEIACNCKFNDCTHTHEPGCAVKEAIKNNIISEERLKNYHKLKKEVEYNQDKVAYLKKVEEYYKSIARKR